MRKFLFLTVTFLSFTFLLPSWAERLAYAPDKKITVLANLHGGFSVKKAGQDWQHIVIPHNPSQLRAASYANGLFELIGENNLIISYDGNQWQQGLGSDLNSNGVLNAIQYIGNQWFAVGSYRIGGKGGIWSSEDGVHWINRVKKARWFNLNAIAYDGKSTVVAVGKRGQYIYSHDGGRTLHSGSLGGLADFHDVTFAQGPFKSNGISVNGIFVAVGGYSTVYYSVDAVNWQPATFTNFNINTSLNKVIYVPDLHEFIIIGDKITQGMVDKYGLTVLMSTNGQTWTKICDECRAQTSLDHLVVNANGVFAGGYTVHKRVSNNPTLFHLIVNKNTPTIQIFLPVQNQNGKFIGEDIDSLLARDDKQLVAVSLSGKCEHNKYSDRLSTFISAERPDYWNKSMTEWAGESCSNPIIP